MTKGDGQQPAGGRILVTGGAGFIGSNLVRLLLEHGFQATVLDNLTVGRRENLEGLPVDFVQGDILDTGLVDRLVRDHDSVVHLAAQSGVPTSLADPRKDCQLNVIGTLNMLEACRHGWDPAEKHHRLVFASSNAPLGRQIPPATEDKAPLPISPYGASKLAGEAYCLGYHGSWGLGTVALRFANVYGPFSGHKTSVVAKFFKDILASDEITIDGDGQQTRDFIYVGDLCRAIVAGLQTDACGEVFQIATGVETSILELVELAQRVVGHEVKVAHAPRRQGDPRKNYSAITKAREVLGWVPQIGLEEGLERTYRWLEASR